MSKNQIKFLSKFIETPSMEWYCKNQLIDQDQDRFLF